MPAADERPVRAPPGAPARGERRPRRRHHDGFPDRPSHAGLPATPPGAGGASAFNRRVCRGDRCQGLVEAGRRQWRPGALVWLGRALSHRPAARCSSLINFPSSAVRSRPLRTVRPAGPARQACNLDRRQTLTVGTLEAKMTRLVRLFLALGMAASVAAPALAESPIPESRVPGFGGRDTRPGTEGGSPSASGSDIGSNVGAGASAAPTVDIITPSTPPTAGGDIKPPTGTSGSLTVTR